QLRHGGRCRPTGPGGLVPGRIGSIGFGVQGGRLVLQLKKPLLPATNDCFPIPFPARRSLGQVAIVPFLYPARIVFVTRLLLGARPAVLVHGPRPFQGAMLLERLAAAAVALVGTKHVFLANALGFGPDALVAFVSLLDFLPVALVTLVLGSLILEFGLL